MGAIKEVLVPDIGDFKDVDVIEVLVHPGDAIEAEQSLITVESDKATMEIPAPFAGVVKEVRIKVGDKVSKGTPILAVEDGHAAQERAAPPAQANAEAPPPRPAAPEKTPVEPAPPRTPVPLGEAAQPAPVPFEPVPESGRAPGQAGDG